jgi:hypothetical protein
LVGAAYLINWFIAGLHPNSWEIIGIPLFLYLLASAIRNLIVLIANLKDRGSEKFGVAVGRCLLGVVILFLTIPTARFAQHIRTERFLSQLPRYQRVVDGLIQKEMPNLPEVTSSPLPDGYTDLGIGNVTIDRTSNGIFVAEFVTEGYGLPQRHEGYIYVSTDDPASLHGLTPFQGQDFIRVAPHWFAWAD